jgi:uncharacterized MAPEG superfamily protein
MRVSEVHKRAKVRADNRIATMNTLVAAYLGLRVLYSVLYVKIEANKLSYARSGTWALGVALLMTMFVKAGNKLNSV